MTPCWCGGEPTYDEDCAFEEGDGFVCSVCDANVYYDEKVLDSAEAER